MLEKIHPYFLLGLGNKVVNKIEARLQRPHLASRPVVVDVVLTKACNFACTFCKDYETPDGAKRISLANFEQVARQTLPTASRLNICSGGEPYLHTGLEDILRIARRYRVETWLLSNGSILKEERVRTMVREGLVSEHGFSVDGYRADTVESIRLNGKLDVILANVEMLQRIKREEKKNKPRIIIRYALMRRNIEELSAAIHQWGRMGADEIHCGYLSLANSMPKSESLFYHDDLLAKCLSDAREAASFYPKLKVNLPDTIADEKEKKVRSCLAPWNFVMIDTNGEIMPCYRAFEALRFPSVYDGEGRPFEDIWNSEAYLNLRSTVNASDKERFYPYCEVCENRCGWGEERTHLGDQTWIKVLGEKWTPKGLDHQRPLKGTARLARVDNQGNRW